jgi:hypothetical protein
LYTAIATAKAAGEWLSTLPQLALPDGPGGEDRLALEVREVFLPRFAPALLACAGAEKRRLVEIGLPIAPMWAVLFV